MSDIREILAGADQTAIVGHLKSKNVAVPAWSGPNGLVNEYDPKRHPVMDKTRYQDIAVRGRAANIEVTRIPLGFQKLAAKRMSDLCTGIPVSRVYKPTNDRQKEIASYLEKIFARVGIDTENHSRCRDYFAACEIMTLWYAVEEPNNRYGFDSPLKLRMATFSPIEDDQLYPLFDEYGDMVAMSVGYSRKVGSADVNYFDTYTADRHIKWAEGESGWAVEVDEPITIGKIPAIYLWRKEPIWEDTSKMVYEMEWSLSRNGNYLRENSKPVMAVFASDVINYGDEKDPDEEFRTIMQFPEGGRAEYISWAQSTESLTYQVDTLRSLFFTTLQLPDWSYEKMSQVAMSGESRKQLFIDALLKVSGESGRLVKFFDREVSVVKAFLKIMLGEGYAADIDALEVECVVTPFTIGDDKETINNLLMANGGEPIMSQRESIEIYGHSNDVDQTLKEIREQREQQSVFDQEDAQWLANA